MGLQLAKPVPLLLRPRIADAGSVKAVCWVTFGVNPIYPEPGTYAQKKGMRELSQLGGIICF